MQQLTRVHLIAHCTVSLQCLSFSLRERACLYVFLFSRPGPNSPISWIKACVEHLVPDPLSPNRRKILLGLNFYGNDYRFGGGGPIIGSQ